MESDSSEKPGNGHPTPDKEDAPCEAGHSRLAFGPLLRAILRVTLNIPSNIFHLVRAPWYVRLLVGIMVLCGILLYFLVVQPYVQGQAFTSLRGLFGGNASVKPVVLVVLPTTKVAEDLKKGIEAAGDAAVQPAVLEPFTEAGALEDIARNLQARLRRNPPVVLVIGHETSTSAAYMIEHVYEAQEFIERKQPIPVILPAATNPLITETPPAEKNLHILRLPASDRKQIQAIKEFVQFAREHSTPDEASQETSTTRQWPTSPRVALLVDNSNPTYSRFFAVSLIADLPEYIVDSIGVDIASQGFSPSAFLGSRPDVVIFAGMHTQAVVFLRRLLEEYNLPKKHQAKFPEILFTDGVVSTFFERMVRDHATTTQLANHVLFFTAPMLPEAGKGEKVRFPTYEAFGNASAQLAGDLVRRAESDGRVDRAGILKQIRLLVKSPDWMGYGPGAVIKVKFDEKGDNTAAEAHVYELVHGVTYHSRRCPCAR